jgi:phytanoyl-CoA dioxygenase PhyH
MNAGLVNPLPGVPIVESPFFEVLSGSFAEDAEAVRIARDLNRNGYAIFDFPDPDFAARAAALPRAMDRYYNWADWRASGGGMRVHDAWKFDPNAKAIAVNARVIELLSRIYGRRAWPFQTLNFPVGTEQHYHSDSVHFSSCPERFMCGVWVALEDVHEDAGPLLYYPGSHKWPIYTNEHLGICGAHEPGIPGQATFEPLWRRLVEQTGITPQRFLPRKGQALIWAANLLHGGDVHRDRRRTRHSQVTHYYFDDCTYYTPMHSDPFYGSIAYRRLVDISTGLDVPNQCGGHRVPDAFIEQVQYHVKG